MVLDIPDGGAAALDGHMVDDFFFADVLAIADKAHINHSFEDILSYRITGDSPQLK
jgi:hypothetical protein